MKKITGVLAVLLFIGSLIYLYNIIYLVSSSTYPVKFSIHFLEDVRPGTKIRYQGALIIGTVQKIETENNIHIIYSNIDKNFLIPKQSIKISLKTWGYFGGKFINITVFNPSGVKEYYQANDTIPLEEVVNSSIILKKINKIIAKEKGQKYSFLEEKLASIQKTQKEIKQSKYFKRKTINNVVKEISNDAIQNYKKIHGILKKSYDITLGYNKITNESIQMMESNIPFLKRKTTNWNIFLKYIPFNIDTPAMKYLHTEAGYHIINEYIKFTIEKLKIYKQQPSKMIFN